jgi:ubiquinone/menaquinone biosynthesis C-methylase UbiE
MKLNWAERWVVNNPLRVIQQGMIVRWMRDSTGPRHLEGVLEVGCGRGAGARSIVRELEPRHVYATDLDPAMVGRARTYLEPSERATISLASVNASCLPFPDGSLDAVFGFGVLHHILDWQTALAEIMRVLRDGGAYYLEELYPTLYQNFITKHILLHPRENRFSAKDFKDALAENGFSLIAARENEYLGIVAVCEKNRPGIPSSGNPASLT